MTELVEVPSMACYNHISLDYVFVYGTLKRGFRLHNYLANTSTFVQVDRIKGFMFTRGNFPGVILDSSGMDIQGELFRIDPTHKTKLISDLDRLEGTPTHYCRWAIRTQGGYVAWVYAQPHERLYHGDMITPEGMWKYERQDWVKWEKFLLEKPQYKMPGKPKVKFDPTLKCMVVEQSPAEGAEEFTSKMMTVKLRGHAIIHNPNGYGSSNYSSPPKKPKRPPMVELAWLDEPGSKVEKYDGDRASVDLI